MVHRLFGFLLHPHKRLRLLSVAEIQLGSQDYWRALDVGKDYGTGLRKKQCRYNAIRNGIAYNCTAVNRRYMWLAIALLIRGSVFHKLVTKRALGVGFEPTRAKPNSLAGCRLTTRQPQLKVPLHRRLIRLSKNKLFGFQIR